MKKAFTLIELLVVIAIIAILAAILFPVFAQAKAAAKKTAALSNVKQNATAVFLYLGDYDDTFPMVAYMANGNGYIGASPAGNGNIVASVFDVIIPYTKNKDIFLSPTDPKAIYWSDSPQSSSTVLGSLNSAYTSQAGIQYASFGPNFRLFEDTAVTAPFGLQRPTRGATSLPNPAGTTMFYDARRVKAGTSNPDLTAAQWATEATNNPNSVNYASRPASALGLFSRFNFPGTPRYSGSMVVNWADGHASIVKGNNNLQGTATEGGVSTRAYWFPYDLNGIPDVVAESVP